MVQGKLFRTVLVMCLTLTLGMTCFISHAHANTVLKYSDHDPTGGLRTDFYKNVLFPEITKQTNGRITFQEFWGGALLSATEVLDGIGDGVTDMGMIFADFYPKRLIMHQGFRVFPAGPSQFEIMNKLYMDVYAQIPEFADEFKRFNQRPIFVTAGLPNAFISRNPLPNIDAIKGEKWRASSRWVQMFLKNAGATAVFIPWAECYMSLQTGALDGNLSNYDGLHMSKQDEVAPNILVAPELWFGTPFVLTMNNDIWESLSKEDQEGINRAVAIATKLFATEYSKAITDIFEAQKKAGLNPRYLSSDEIAAWEAKCAEVNAPAIWREELKKSGIKNADKAVDTFTKIYEEAMAESRKQKASAAK